MTTASYVLSQVRISELYAALTGVKPRRTGSESWRGPAAWRDGDGFNVSMDDNRGVWHDFVTGEGGGVLDLVLRNREGNRADALRFVADFAGVPLDDRPAHRAERRVFAERREIATIANEEIESWRAALIPELDRRKLAALRSGDDDALARVASLCNLVQNGLAADIIREFIRHRASDPAEVARLIAARREYVAESERITAEAVLLLAAAEGSGDAL